MKQLSLPHVIKLPISDSEHGPDEVHPTILALHGRGSNEHDLIGLADYLPGNFIWISPRGPFDLGPDSHEWFQITEIGKPDAARLANALGVIDHFIDEIVVNYPVDKSKLYLLGFSQGTIVSLSYALTHPQRIAGVIAQSGYIPHESGLTIDAAGIKNKPILMTHGIQDPMLPVDWARRSRDTLQNLETDLEYHEFNMGHNVNAEALAVIRTWLEKQLSMIIPLLEKAIASRAPLMDLRHEGAFQLFNGFTEGYADLALDVYAGTLVIHNYADDPWQNQNLIQEVTTHLQGRLNWLHAGILKLRNGKTQEEKRGGLIFGTKVDRKIKEHGIWYALDLMMNRDASLYLDTRILRKWLIENMQGRSVLNTFAYTGSLGVAAIAGGAGRVVQTDINREFLNLAKDSYSLNGFPIHKQDFIAQDFFPVVANFKGSKQFFDCVIIDPPFFSTTTKGRVDQEAESARLINKVRPLINDGGYLIAINNAVYVSGQEYIQTLEALCKDGYLKIRELIPVPEDFTGNNKAGSFITDPAPFNHSTKIAILDVKRK